MSRIGKRPVDVPGNVQVSVDGSTVRVKGPKGELSRTFSPELTIKQEGATVTVERPSDEPRHKALHGLSRSLLNNLVQGVSQGYERKLEIHGVGYRVQARGSDLEFALGFSHPVKITPPDGITFAVESPTRFSVQGIDKQLVGQVAANIRWLRRPDPYKGKGVRYAGEQIRRKVGKTGK